MKKHSFKKSGTNFYKNGEGGGPKAIYKLYKKTDVLETGVVPYFVQVLCVALSILHHFRTIWAPYGPPYHMDQMTCKRPKEIKSSEHPAQLAFSSAKKW